MLARFFIDRPIFAWVISIVIVGGGLVAGSTLPIAQYPEITPPSVQVSCVYPGASAAVVRDTVAAPIEQQVNGVEGMMYMSSQSSNDGSYNLTVTFKLGVNLDMAQVLVQNRVSQALASLPDVVQSTGVITKKKSPSILLVVNLYSETNPETNKPYFDQLYLSNYATIQVRDELSRLEGVGDVTLLGQQDYSMRVWLDPNKLATRNMTAADVVNALREQNVQVAAGAIGRPPVPKGQDFQYTMSTLGRLTNAEEFAEVIIRTGSGGLSSLLSTLTGSTEDATAVVRLKDVGRIELGPKAQDTMSTLDGAPSAGVAIFQLPGSNALNVADEIRAKMKVLEEKFPKGVKSAIVYDTTPFITESVTEVFKTLRDAVILVAIVVLLFLQDWKSMILPLIDVGVSLIGTLAVMKLMGFSLNNLTLFGLVLAIGIVVDDAIVVLENIERWLAMGHPVRAATIGAMGEITGPIVGITLVLSSVFIPSAFIPGITGQFYKQFALTIAVSMIISAINAMTMTPARATAIFGGRTHGEHGAGGHEALPWWGLGLILAFFFPKLLALAGLDQKIFGKENFGVYIMYVVSIVICGAIGLFSIKPINAILSKFFKQFNRLFEFFTRVYGRVIAGLLRVSLIVLLVYGGLLALTYYGFTRIPVGFIPSQDKGYLLVNVQLPDSASLERTAEVMKRVGEIAAEDEATGHTVGIPGQSFILNAVSSNFGSMFVVLKPFHERHGHDLSADAVIQRLQRRFATEILEAQVLVFGAPAVDGLGNGGGFKLMVEDRGDNSLDVLQGQADNLAEQGRNQPGLVGLFNGFRANTPQLFVDIDREKCKTLGVSLNDAFNTLQVYMGGAYVNDFNRFGRTWQVNVQADESFRVDAERVKQLKVRNLTGSMVPLGTLATIRDVAGPVVITRYNLYPAAPINGGSLPGVSTGTVINTMEKLAKSELPQGMTIEWTELTYLQTQAGGTAIFAFVGAVMLVFLVLAAQYESWSLPMSVILVVPMCLLCALAGVAMAKMDMNIFVQVGFVVLVGLACKNAILVVEFAREREHEGMSAADAAVAASTSRLRPIIMTSLAFILGVFPLVIGQGAGAEMRRTLGTAVFSGMIGVTAFGLFLTPVFYYVVRRLNGSAAGPTPAGRHQPKDQAAHG